MGVKIVSEDPIVEGFAIMAVSVVLSIVVRDARRSNDAPATTAGAVPIDASQSRMTATDLLSIATVPRGS